MLDAWETLLIVDNWQFHVVVRKLDDNDGIDNDGIGLKELFEFVGHSYWFFNSLKL